MTQVTDATLNEFIEALTKFVNDGAHATYTTFSYEKGKKFIRIVSAYASSRSCYCFLDFEGNIYKSESWKKPAKHIRGKLSDENFSLGKALGRYGAAYLR